jgi:hypothetical protein
MFLETGFQDLGFILQFKLNYFESNFYLLQQKQLLQDFDKYWQNSDYFIKYYFYYLMKNLYLFETR